MQILSILSPSEQVADYLRKELILGSWKVTMPGVPTLSNELGIDHKTIASALILLEQDGLLLSQGAGRARLILNQEYSTLNSLRIAILEFDKASQGADYMIDLMHRLELAGHVPFFTEKTLIDLAMDRMRVERFVKKTKADAWIVCAAARDVLSWFAEYEKPAFALFGRRGTLPMAGVGPDHIMLSRQLIRKLTSLGHRRIVTITRHPRRLPEPGECEQAILEEMQSAGITTGPYNLPDWEETPEGFYQLLDELFKISPPTALIIYESSFFHAAKDYLAQRGVFAPQHISLICTDPDPNFVWCKPAISHFQWSYAPIVQRVVRWVNKVAKGKDDLQQTLTAIELIEGGTIGPAPR